MLPKAAGAAAAAKGKRKAPAGDAAGTRKKPAAAQAVRTVGQLPLWSLQAEQQTGQNHICHRSAVGLVRVWCMRRASCGALTSGDDIKIAESVRRRAPDIKATTA